MSQSWLPSGELVEHILELVGGAIQLWYVLSFIVMTASAKFHVALPEGAERLWVSNVKVVREIAVEWKAMSPREQILVTEEWF